MKGMAPTEDQNACISNAWVSDVYSVEATGASVTTDSSVSLIHQYCEKLPGDKCYASKPTFKYISSEGSFQCELTLPASAAFRTIVCLPSRDSNLAKQLVCLEACKKLHQMGALDDYLQPCIEEQLVKGVSLRSQGSASKAGTTKRKELHGTTLVHALWGSWGAEEDGAVFQAYQFTFACNIIGEIYSGFVLLIESTLDDDVGNVEMDLYLLGKVVKASISSCGRLNLDHKQMAKAKCFQEFLFNGLFGRLFIESKATGKNREFLLQTDTKLLWKSSYMYLLLPVEAPDSSDHKSWRINWASIDSCVSVVDFLKRNSLLNVERCNNDLNEPSDGDCETTQLIHFANGTFDAANLKDMVVIAIHSGRIYSIVEAVNDTSAESPFEGNAEGVPPEYTSYMHYFNKKYGVILMHPKQPLMRLKQSHNPHNLLVNFSDEGTSKNAVDAGVVKKKPQMHVHVPPELLVSINIHRSILKSLYLLPSVMHRLESLMLAGQLREEINCCVDSIRISSSLILEALTTLGCCEAFSMERLELLGDSVLKYAVSCYLYLKYPSKHEGQLSSWRSASVCNSMLYRLGTNRKLQGYIRDGAFDPRRWVAPGQRTLRLVPCKCGVGTSEVPLDPKFHTEDPKIKVGKRCDMGHRWMGSKTISDCVEALIGAYYVNGGLTSALHTMKWLGIDVDLNPSLVMDAINSASLRSYIPKNGELDNLEVKLGHKFSARFLLQEACMHQSQKEDYSYQRLEFLGDSVLDLLITWHLYQSYPRIDPGELTDMRSASVNNENFAQVAVRKNLYTYLQHSSPTLLDQIKEYVKSFPDPDGGSGSGPSIQGPKALGDLVESIAGAILIDTKLNLDEVWRIFEPLLSPLITPDKLELPPLRELIELCSSLGYFFDEKCITKGETVHVELRLQLKDVLLVGKGSERTRKLAKAKAASNLLKELEKRNTCKRKMLDVNNFKDSSSMEVDCVSQNLGMDLSGIEIHKTQKIGENKMPVVSKASLLGDCTMEACVYSSEVPVIPPISIKKGGPRTSLFEFCKSQLWPMPKFETMEHKSRTPIEFEEGSEKRTGFNSFVSTITLCIPGSNSIVCTGDAKADKKSSFDSAALAMLYELKKQGKLVISQY